MTNIGAAVATLALRFRAKNICWPETLERAKRVKRLIGRPQEALLCAKAKRQRQMFSVAKAKRQLQSAQSERKSTLALPKSDTMTPSFLFFYNTKEPPHMHEMAPLLLLLKIIHLKKSASTLEIFDVSFYMRCNCFFL
ncbi:hypothetical protein [Lysinibacillus sp. Bpr_S20]|uniref:hypothetical protein n=1 Tax=Lysinibacillus sp. Bpr_S20 TaxID=2933964 RepID=UPI002011E4B2|nr:hypothetical protein [Lysinibacillus sp. Bpr_S20]MCL1703167.1 hypothetical protein [Lysinibacillus sp. Bpr_S20]